MRSVDSASTSVNCSILHDNIYPGVDDDGGVDVEERDDIAILNSTTFSTAYSINILLRVCTPLRS